VVLPFGADGAIYEQFSGGITASCRDNDADDD
jgi:hypothetical protein